MRILDLTFPATLLNQTSCSSGIVLSYATWMLLYILWHSEVERLLYRCRKRRLGRILICVGIMEMVRVSVKNIISSLDQFTECKDTFRRSFSTFRPVPPAFHSSCHFSIRRLLSVVLRNGLGSFNIWYCWPCLVASLAIWS
ncbi:hypothetical protein AVEN_141316-1 [Araneus ventricosus]|uniref:Uncharacterized protein n=1 Tax=Araneus ventricosus TaxID=182803 RepID=A0A4Y2KWZ8_ARAVE|nr:hypothetical protein AVEN_141316-1 [Araneus ventricosus]